MNYDEHDDAGYSGAGRYPGSHKPVKKPPGPPVERDEAGSIFYAPTARSEFREMRSELLALVATIERGKPKVSDPVELERIEEKLDLMRFFMPKLDEAFELGQDSKSVALTLRFCPDCPKGKTPLSKNKQFCARHARERRKNQNRLAQQRFKEKHKKGKTSKQTSLKGGQNGS